MAERKQEDLKALRAAAEDGDLDALVRRLAAPLGVEGGAVQYNIKALVPLFTGKDLGLKFNQECVLFVELFRHR